MTAIASEDLREFLRNYLSRELEASGRKGCEDLPEDCDFSDMIDSLGFLNLIAAIQEFVGHEIDFELLGPEQITIVGPLCRFIAQQTDESSAVRRSICTQ